MTNASTAAPAAVALDASDVHAGPAHPTTRTWTWADAALILLAVALAVAPRAVNLLGMDPFVDEASSLDWPLRLFELTSPRTWILSTLQDGRPPLYLWLVVPFATVIDNGFLAGRVLSVLADLGCVVALYALGRELASRTVGTVAAILWALSPLSIFFARLAVDDSLLTLMAVLTTLTSARLARRPTVANGALCGLSLGLTVLVKTNGALLAMALPLALVVLGQPSNWRAYVRPLVAAGLASLLPVPLLILGALPVLHQIVDHTRAGDSGHSGVFATNAVTVAGWLETFVGNRFLLVAGAGFVLALLFRQFGLIFVALLGFAVLTVIVAISSPIFARRLLLPGFPAFLLAAYAIERAAFFVTWGLRAVRVGNVPLRLAAGLVVVILGLVAALEERADLAVTMVRDPARAELPGSEHLQYFENWYALYGMNQIADELRAHGQERPVTVLVPPASRENRVLVPYNALRYYLRRDPTVRFVEAPALFRAQDLRELRRLTRDGPTYLLINGSYTDASGMPNDAPAYTRQVERRLAQDLPGAREVLRIPRPTAPNWLSLYRLDE